jgi:fused signal recognition particle receptor
MADKGKRLIPQAAGAGLARRAVLGGVFRPLIKHYVHPEVIGLENLAGQEPPLILAANHSSHMDTPLILNSMPKELRRKTVVAAASDYFFSNRSRGLFVSVALGAVPMDRQVGSRQTMDAVSQLLADGWCLIIYPEGSRTLDGRLYRGKTGIARLALSARAPIVPVGIAGTYDSMPAGRGWPVSGHVQVRFGKPLTFDRYLLGVADQLVLRAITDQVMYEIMMLSGQTYIDEYVTSAKLRRSRLDSETGQEANGTLGAPAPDEAEGAPGDMSDQGTSLSSAGRRGSFGLRGGFGCLSCPLPRSSVKADPPRPQPSMGSRVSAVTAGSRGGGRLAGDVPAGPGGHRIWETVNPMALAYIILIVVLGVIAIGAGSFLLLFQRPRRGRTARPSAPPTTQAPGGGGGEADTAAAPETPAATTGVVEIERPPPSAGRMVRLRARLARSQSTVGSALLGLLSRDRLDDETWDEIEEVLITADVGVVPARQMVDDLRTKVKVLGARGPDEVRGLLRTELLTQLGTDTDRSLHVSPHGGVPAVVLMVGVNGTGKTTTVGKLARALIGDGHTVLLGAADTFRAAAVDQLQTWGDRVGAETVRAGREGADPASVAYEAVTEGIKNGVDAVIIDTAGRLHTKVGLMDELGKVKRVVEKQAPVDEVLLVIDATTGQNGLRQARVFAEVVNITGLVLTKLDGTAKGGIVIAVQRELGVPVKLVGLGEGQDDLAPFDPETFVDAILG